jgi:tetratricopeptide (TPR) repeat protein
MAIDQYAICPCGSGKKIKFCKCFDSIGDLDRVMKMVQGGQMVAAIDRLNQVFKQHPTAAWALAIKGRLLIGMDEVPALTENAERFIRLQPSNPLALAQKAAAEAAEQKFTAAAHSILQALAESGQTVDSFLVEICGLLAVGLVQTGNFLSARMYATIALMASNDDQYQQLPRMVLDELNSSRDINLLLKSLPTTIARPANVSWGERFDEAQGLLYSNQILASEAKLEALDRQNPGEPAIMMSLFVCSIWRADAEGQARLLRKVSEKLDADPEKANRLLAISLLVNPENRGVDVSVKTLNFAIDDADKAVLELTGNDRFQSLPTQFLSRVTNQDGIHPRAAFAVLDRPKLEADATDVEVDSIPDFLGLVSVFGRQTDRSPEIMVQQVMPAEQQKVTEQIHSALQIETQPSDQQEWIPIESFLSPRVFMPEAEMPREKRDQYVDQLFQRHFQNHVIDFQLKFLEGSSLRQLRDDPSTMKVRTAISRVVRGSMQLAEMKPVLESFDASLGVEPVGFVDATTDEQLESLQAFDLARVDIENLSEEGLFYFFERASQVSLVISAAKSARRIIKLDSTDEDTMEMVLRAYVMLVSSEADPQVAIATAEDAKAWCKKHQVSDASVLLSLVPRYLQMRDSDGFSRLLQEIQSRHGQNPEVMTHLTRMLIDLGFLNPDGTPRQMGRQAPPEPAEAGGLWTGGAQGPAAPGPVVDAPSAAPSEGGSKLWLPGMQ